MALLSLQQIHKTFEKGTVNENHVLRGFYLCYWGKWCW